MLDEWKHPILGNFKHDDIWWRQIISLPSLKSFSYVDAAVQGYRSIHEDFDLLLECDSDSDVPNDSMVELAISTIGNEAKLVAKILMSVWEDINGRGPDTGMWWHGDLPNAYRGAPWASAILENLTEYNLPIPKQPEDLKTILEPHELLIRRDNSPPNDWVGEFSFYAGFDVEHGLGVLTDGMDILGIGYSAIANRFRK
jgi:hypothetical protein